MDSYCVPQRPPSYLKLGRYIFMRGPAHAPFRPASGSSETVNSGPLLTKGPCQDQSLLMFNRLNNEASPRTNANRGKPRASETGQQAAWPE